MTAGGSYQPPHLLAQNGEVVAVVEHWGGDVLGLGRSVALVLAEAGRQEMTLQTRCPYVRLAVLHAQKPQVLRS